MENIINFEENDFVIPLQHALEKINYYSQQTSLKFLTAVQTIIAPKKEKLVALLKNKTDELKQLQLLSAHVDAIISGTPINLLGKKLAEISFLNKKIYSNNEINYNCIATDKNVVQIIPWADVTTPTNEKKNILVINNKVYDENSFIIKEVKRVFDNWGNYFIRNLKTIEIIDGSLFLTKIRTGNCCGQLESEKIFIINNSSDGNNFLIAIGMRENIFNELDAENLNFLQQIFYFDDEKQKYIPINLNNEIKKQILEKKSEIKLIDNYKIIWKKDIHIIKKT